MQGPQQDVRAGVCPFSLVANMTAMACCHGQSIVYRFFS
jgi:hypothetical protein